MTLDLSAAVTTFLNTPGDYPGEEEERHWAECLLRATLPDIIEALADDALNRYANAEARMARYEADEYGAAAEYLRRKAEEVRA